MNLHTSQGLFDVTEYCLGLSDPHKKVAATLLAARNWRAQCYRLGGDSSVKRIESPGRPPRPRLVSPHELPMRKLGNRQGHAAFMHAIAHIEFNAINLAWDAVYRFRDLPRGFYDDWVRIAEEESRHFQAVREYLQKRGFDYGSFDAHNNLWEMALDTDDDALMRMALVPRVLEARGLDVTPGMIDRLAQQGFDEAVDILEVIYREEVGHVEAGSRWFRYLCEQRGLAFETAFESLIAQYARQRIRKPINDEARKQAGFTENEINYLYTLL